MQLPKKGLTALFFLNNKQIKFKNKYKETLEKKHIKRRFKFGNFNTKKHNFVFRRKFTKKNPRKLRRPIVFLKFGKQKNRLLKR